MLLLFLIAAGAAFATDPCPPHTTEHREDGCRLCLTEGGEPEGWHLQEGPRGTTARLWEDGRTVESRWVREDGSLVVTRARAWGPSQEREVCGVLVSVAFGPVVREPGITDMGCGGPPREHHKILWTAQPDVPDKVGRRHRSGDWRAHGTQVAGARRSHARPLDGWVLWAPRSRRMARHGRSGRSRGRTVVPRQACRRVAAQSAGRDHLGARPLCPRAAARELGLPVGGRTRPPRTVPPRKPRGPVDGARRPRPARGAAELEARVVAGPGGSGLRGRSARRSSGARPVHTARRALRGAERPSCGEAPHPRGPPSRAP